MKITPVNYNYTTQKNQNNSQPAFGKARLSEESLYRVIEAAKVPHKKAERFLDVMLGYFKKMDRMTFDGKDLELEVLPEYPGLSRNLQPDKDDVSYLFMAKAKTKGSDETGNALFKVSGTFGRLTTARRMAKRLFIGVNEAVKDLENSKGYIKSQDAQLQQTARTVTEKLNAVNPKTAKKAQRAQGATSQGECAYV